MTETVGRVDESVPKAVATELARLRAENARLLRLLELTPGQAALPRPARELLGLVVRALQSLDTGG